MVCDYIFIRGTELDVNSLYHERGAYQYNRRTWGSGVLIVLLCTVVLWLLFARTVPIHQYGPAFTIGIVGFFLIGSVVWLRGVNPRAMIALGLGVGVALVGLIVPSLHFLYDYAWFVGFFTAGATYVAMMKFAAPAAPVESAEAANA